MQINLFAMDAATLNRSFSIVANARHMGKTPLPVAVALSMVAPIPGRTWTSICCWCLDHLEHDAPDEVVHRLADGTRGDCMRCAYTGEDTLVVALADGR